MTYDLITISIPLILAYSGSYLLYHKNYIKKALHVRIWNILILITFLISAGAGLVLLSLVEYGLALPFSQSLLYWHIEFGIAMFWIALFHIHSYWIPSKKNDGKTLENPANSKTNKRNGGE